MAEYTILKLKNFTPVHIGTGKENYDFSSDVLSSDSLSAALASLRVMEGKKDDVDQFLSSFSLSSAFPYVGDRYFLPRPIDRLPVSVKNGKDEHLYRKELKKIKYIELPLWCDIVSGKSIEIDHSQLQKSFFTVAGQSFKNPNNKQVVQRVFVPRDGDVAEPFFFEWQYFIESSGLFCILNSDESVAEELYGLMVSLGEMGIGTDKSVGGGKFEVEKSTINLPDVANPSASMLLSTYIPTEDEMGILKMDQARYNTVVRSGFLAGSTVKEFNHLRKRSIYMFDVGSVFPTVDRLQGKVVDLQPSWNDERMHPVYRSGKPFVVQIHLFES